MSLFHRRNRKMEKEIHEELEKEEIKRAVRDEKLYERIVAEELAGIKATEQANLILVTSERGAEWLGTPQSFIVLDGFYYIKFLPAPPSFSDALLAPLKKLLGIKGEAYVLKAHKDLVVFNSESITVFAEKLVHDVETNIITAIAPASDIVTRKGLDSYEALVRERDILKEKLEMVLEQEKKLIEVAMSLNPYIKLYRKKAAENKEEGEKSEDLFGFELGAFPLGGGEK